MSKVPGVSEIGKATGLSGRPLGVVLIGVGIAAVVVSVPADATIVGIPLGVAMDVFGVLLALTGLILLVKG